MQAGLVYLESGIQPDDVMDPTRMSALLERARPNYPPGTMTIYHEYTFGWLVDQIVRRVDSLGRGVSEYFNEEIV